MAKRQKLINLKDIEKQFKQVNTFETYPLNDKDNSVIKFNPLFDHQIIEDLKNELFEKIKYSQEKKLGFLESDHEFFNYMYFLIIKYFTHFKDIISDDLETQIIQMEKMVSIGLFELIIKDVLPQEEVQLVFDVILDTIDSVEKLDAIEEQHKLNLAKEVKNPVIKKRVGLDGAV